MKTLLGNSKTKLYVFQQTAGHESVSGYVMIMEIEKYALSHKKIWLSRAGCSHTKTSINTPGTLLNISPII
jgi:hypothetical protein